MAIFQSGNEATWKAGADLSAKQHFFVVATSTEGEVDASGAAAAPLGILTNDPTSGQEASVQCGGSIAILEVDGSGTAIAINDYLKSDANGRGVKAATGDLVGARALQAATGLTDEIMVRPLPPGTKAP